MEYHPRNARDRALEEKTMSEKSRLLVGMAGALILGLMLGMALTLYFATKQVRTDTDAINAVKDQCKTTIADVQRGWQKATDLWEQRAQKCEVKERNATVVYEYRPGTSIPVLHGAFAITLGSAANHPDSDVKPVWVIPVQTPVYTNLPNTSYEWVDGKTGASIGRFPATPPPATSITQ